MKAVVREIGDRPVIGTPARFNAPEGAKAFADIMAERDFADMCIINIDWDGDGHTPVMMVVTIKWFPEYGGQRLEHEWPVDLDDAFGQDNMDQGILRSMANQLEEHFNEMIAARRRAN
jgi:hypothetical protein